MDFHELCDDKGQTLVLLKSREGFIGGGFTTKSWESSKLIVYTYIENIAHKRSGLSQCRTQFCHERSHSFFTFKTIVFPARTRGFVRFKSPI